MSYTTLKDRDVTVRKAHRCVWCAEYIEVGEPARYRAYVWDGDFGNDWAHPECRAAMESAPSDVIEEGWYPGEFKRGSNEER